MCWDWRVRYDSCAGLKGVPQEDIIVDIQPKALHITIRTPGFDVFDKTLSLFNAIDPATSSYQFVLRGVSNS